MGFSLCDRVMHVVAMTVVWAYLNARLELSSNYWDFKTKSPLRRIMSLGSV